MTSRTSRPLGILTTEWEGGYPRGNVGNPETFNFPIITETVQGAHLDRLWARDPLLKPALISAAQRLVERGAVAITSTCALFVWHQPAVAASVKVPVVLSSLPLLALLLRQVPPNAKVGVLSVSFPSPYDAEVLGLENSKDRERVVFGGCEGAYEQSVKTRTPPKRELSEVMSGLEEDVAAGAMRLRLAHPDVGAILFTCVGFSCVAPMVRQKTGLPVYSVADLCRLTMASLASG